MLNRLFRALAAALLAMLCLSAASAEAVPPELRIRVPDPVPPVPREATGDAGLSAASVADFVTDGSGLITAYQGADAFVTVPAEIDGVAVTGIGYGAFRDNTALTGVSLPEGLTNVGYLAFAGCTGLKSVSLPDSLAVIEGWAFQGCASLEAIDVPGNVTVIGECAFYQCPALTDVTLPDGLTVMGDWVFSGCDALKEIVIPHSVTSVGEYAFYNCRALELLRLSDGMTFIGNTIAAYCENLVSVNIPAAAKEIGEYAFFGCGRLTGLVLPEGLSAVKDYAFCGCTGLERVTVPSTAKSFGVYAFGDCVGIQRLELPDGIESLAEGSMPPNAVLVFGSSKVIEEYAVSHGMKFICDSKDTASGSSGTVEEKIDWVLDNYLSPGMSEYEKALRLYNWLCANVAYDYQWLETGVATTEYGVTGEGALLGGWAVCEGYAKAYMWLLDAAGLEARYVYGHSQGDSHAWNIARIDGKWYQFDPTWDEAGNGSTHIYFGLTDYAMRFNHTQEILKEIACNAYAANYEYRNGEYDALLAALRGEISAAISAGSCSGSVDVTEVEQPDFFWDGPSPCTVAFILNQSAGWPVAGRVEVVPEEPGFRYTFYPNAVAVTDLQVSGLEKPDGAEVYPLAPGETAQLTVVTQPEGVPVTYASSNADVLTVSADGLVTAKAEGFATLTVTAGNLTQEIDVTVSALKIVLGQEIYEGYPGDRIDPDAYLLGDSDGEYRDSFDYLWIELSGGSAVEYPGYYQPEWSDAMNCWNYWFAIDCVEPGAATLVARPLGNTGISASCRFIVHSASPMEIPAPVRELQAEAFAGVTAEEIILPEGLEIIGARVFAGCAGLELVHMPKSLELIDDSAFEGCGDVTLLCEPGALAVEYAQANDIDYIILN